MREHIPKRHHDFENPIITDKVFDNTNGRIHGEKSPTQMVSISNFWGTGRNAADNIPRIGLKTQNIEREIAAQVA